MDDVDPTGRLHLLCKVNALVSPSSGNLAAGIGLLLLLWRAGREGILLERWIREAVISAASHPVMNMHRSQMARSWMLASLEQFAGEGVHLPIRDEQGFESAQGV